MPSTQSILYFHHSRNLALAAPPPPPCFPPSPLIHFIDFSVLTFHINGTIQSVVLCAWLYALSMVF